MELNYGLVPSSALVVDVVTLTVSTTTLVVLVGQVELVVVRVQLGDDIMCCAVVLLESAFALVEVITRFIGLLLVQIPPPVAHQLDHIHVQGELDSVHAVDVIQADVIVMVVVLEDQGSSNQPIARFTVVGHLQRWHHHGQRELELVQFQLQLIGDWERHHEAFVLWKPINHLSFNTFQQHVCCGLGILEMVVHHANQSWQ